MTNDYILDDSDEWVIVACSATMNPTGKREWEKIKLAKERAGHESACCTSCIGTPCAFCRRSSSLFMARWLVPVVVCKTGMKSLHFVYFHCLIFLNVVTFVHCEGLLNIWQIRRPFYQDIIITIIIFSFYCRWIHAEFCLIFKKITWKNLFLISKKNHVSKMY